MTPISWDELNKGQTYLAVCLEGKKQTHIVYAIGGVGPELALISQHHPTEHKMASDYMSWDFYAIDLPPPQRIRGSDVKRNGAYFIMHQNGIVHHKDGHPCCVCDVTNDYVVFFGDGPAEHISKYADFWFILIPYPMHAAWTGETR